MKYFCPVCRIKSYILSLMKDENSSIFDEAVKSVLWVVSRVYGLCINMVAWAYEKGIRKTYKVGVPVVSVGNITLGGTGKTPFSMFIADELVRLGRKPSVIIRGYGRDESMMLKEELADVPVYVGQDRVALAGEAQKEGSRVIVLDDGFQHRRLARDLNIVLIDSYSLFGNGYLFPRGVLRERVTSLRRADLLALTKTDRITSERKDGVLGLLKRLAPGKPVVLTKHRPSFLSDVTGASYPPESLNGRRVGVISGIADPDYFEFLIRELGGRVSLRIDYADHYQYSQKDIDEITSESEAKKIDSVVITKKDYVKIRKFDLSKIEEKIFILNITIEMLEGKGNLIAGLNSISPD